MIGELAVVPRANPPAEAGKNNSKIMRIATTPPSDSENSSSISGSIPGIAARPQPPYYAVIFTSQRNAEDGGYGDAAERMAALAAQQPGYLGVESVRGADGLGITVSYWRGLDDIQAWRRVTEHAAVRDHGRAHWYEGYALRIAKVERAYGWELASDGPADPMGAGA
jgi:heme-degrading monooxygenase HmoA